MKVRWERAGNRALYAEGRQARWQAFVFGTPRPLSLWAWFVVWHNGSMSHVEHSFRSAKARAAECVEEVDRALAKKGGAA